MIHHHVRLRAWTDAEGREATDHYGVNSNGQGIVLLRLGDGITGEEVRIPLTIAEFADFLLLGSRVVVQALEESRSDQLSLGL